MGLQTTLVLLMEPNAVEYYPHVGFTSAGRAWLLKPGETVR